jgi:hypothetical protein
MKDILCGKTYTWELYTITFVNNSRIINPWVTGKYTWLDRQTVMASWANVNHVLTFNNVFTTFKCVRSKDNYIINGTLTLLNCNSKIPSIRIDYKNQVTDLCLLCKKYNIDKSSQRENPGPNDSNHCHPYSLLYNVLFNKNRNDVLSFCEIGIAEGHSLCMWNDYFPKSNIYGFEYKSKWLDNWTQNYSDKARVKVNYTNVMNDSEFLESLKKVGVQYDCIIDDSTHNYYDMIRIIHKSLPFLKAGGMIIIEDIQKAFDESWFYKDLKTVLDEFQTVFFVDLEHDRRNSGIVENDKVLILIKNGDPIFNYSLV